MFSSQVLLDLIDMGGFASKLSKAFSSLKNCPARIAMIGLDGAGKIIFLLYNTYTLWFYRELCNMLYVLNVHFGFT